MTRISVVVPVKDDARELDLCLSALAGQSVSAFEIIVVDNDSSDDSAVVARRHGATVISERQKGIWAAAAAGFDHATGDVIARCDADSRPGDDWLERIGSELDEHPEAVAITGPGRFYELDPVRRMLADVFYMRAYFMLAHGALANRPLFGSNFAIRAGAWHEVSARVHRDDPDVHDDFDLSYHLDPAATVLMDRRLEVGISSRPFSGAASMLVRTKRAVHTVAVHGVRDQPVRRWRRRLFSSLHREVGGSGRGRTRGPHEVP